MRHDGDFMTVRTRIVVLIGLLAGSLMGPRALTGQALEAGS